VFGVGFGGVCWVLWCFFGWFLVGFLSGRPSFFKGRKKNPNQRDGPPKGKRRLISGEARGVIRGKVRDLGVAVSRNKGTLPEGKGWGGKIGSRQPD